MLYYHLSHEKCRHTVLTKSVCFHLILKVDHSKLLDVLAPNSLQQGAMSRLVSCWSYTAKRYTGWHYLHLWSLQSICPVKILISLSTGKRHSFLENPVVKMSWKRAILPLSVEYLLPTQHFG